MHLGARQELEKPQQLLTRYEQKKNGSERSTHCGAEEFRKSEIEQSLMWEDGYALVKSTCRCAHIRVRRWDHNAHSKAL